MVSQLAQHVLARSAVWLTSAMLALPMWPGTACAHAALRPAGAAALCADNTAPAAGHVACCCCARRSTESAGTGCHCNHDSAPTPPAVPADQAQSSAGQVLIAQAAVSIAVAPDASLGGPATMLSRDDVPVPGSALERCVLLSCLTL